MLERWVKESQAEDGQAFRGNGKLAPEQEKIRALKTKVKKLQMEKDILKKAKNTLSSVPDVPGTGCFPAVPLPLPAQQRKRAC